jgi:hypothetical protein
MAIFYSDERAKLSRLEVIRSLVAEQPLYAEPCVLLQNQLADLRVLTKKLLETIECVQQVTDEAIKRSRK